MRAAAAMLRSPASVEAVGLLGSAGLLLKPHPVRLRQSAGGAERKVKGQSIDA